MLKSNLSLFARKAKTAAGRKGNSLFTIIGEEVEEAMTEAFETLVRDTPQYSGTTAASWNIGLARTCPDVVREQPRPKSEAEALKKGDSAAVEIALTENAIALANLSSMNLNQDIAVKNNAPGADTSESGPLRQVNRPSGMTDRFEAAVEAAFSRLESNQRKVL